jgi:NADPH:quinone reductase-like Zn-dependent oxidoreductase
MPAITRFAVSPRYLTVAIDSSFALADAASAHARAAAGHIRGKIVLTATKGKQL